MYSTAQGTGQALGPIIAGYALAANRFDVAFLIAGVIGLGVPAVVGRWRGQADATSRRVSWRDLKHGVAEVGRNPVVLVTSGAQSAQFVLNGMLNAFLPLYGRDVLGLSTTELGWLLGVQTITTLLIRPAIGFLSDYAGRRWVIVAGLSISGAAIVALSLLTNVSAIVAAVLIYAGGAALTTAATSAYITDVTRRARYGAAHGVFGTIYDVGDALGPIAGGLLVAAVGYAHMFQIMASGPLVMAAAFMIASRPFRGPRASGAARCR
jgi:MFS transporter, DHA1 family, multidrug resistance protein